MNARIEELVKAAGGYRIMDELRQSSMDGGKSFTPEAFDKFCELLIKECADFLTDIMDDHFAAEQLLDHFESLK